MGDVLTKKLPWDKNLPFPQRNKFYYKGRTYEVTYRWSSIDDSLIIKIKRELDKRTIHTGRLNEKSFGHVYSPETYEKLFSYWGKTIKKDKLNIWIIDEDFRISD